MPIHDKRLGSRISVGLQMTVAALVAEPGQTLSSLFTVEPEPSPNRVVVKKNQCKRVGASARRCSTAVPSQLDQLSVPRAERRMSRLKEIHDTGIHRSRERQSHRQAARRGSLSVPALPAGYCVGRQALTPPTETRSQSPIAFSEAADSTLSSAIVAVAFTSTLTCTWLGHRRLARA